MARSRLFGPEFTGRFTYDVAYRPTTAPLPNQTVASEDAPRPEWVEPRHSYSPVSSRHCVRTPAPGRSRGARPEDPTVTDAGTPSAQRTRRLILVLLPLLLPWSVQVFSRADATFVFPWGLVNTNPLGVTDLYSFLFVYTAGLPDYILAWPLSVGLYLVGVASVAAGVVAGRAYEDPRVTAAALCSAGVAQLSLALGFSVQPYRTAWPTGTFVLVAVALALYRGAG